MKANLYTFVGLYQRGLDTAAHILAKGWAFADAKGVSEKDYLNWKLADDMFPLWRQLQIVRNFALQWPARAAGLPIPDGLEGEPTLAELHAALSEAKTSLAALKPEQFEGRDEVTATVNIGQMEPTFAMAQWLPGFATPNYYFHLSMGYAILRQKGVDLGKRDFFAGGL